MNYEKLLEYLELADAGEFEFFENLADLVEADMEIEPEAIYQLFDGADKEILSELFGNYFEDLLQSVPEEETALYTLLDSIKMALIGMCRNLEEEQDLVLLADEFYRFRNWYSMDSSVLVVTMEPAEIQEAELPMRDALALVRLENLGVEKYEYSFDGALDFELDQYTMSFADLIQEEEDPEDRDPELDGLDLPELEYTDQIFIPGKLH